MDRLARALGGSTQSPAPGDDPIADMSPVDLLRLRRALAEKEVVSPEQAAANRRATGYEALSMVPGPGNVIAAKDAYDSGREAINSFGEGNLGAGALNTGAAGLSALGAVTGLPFGRLARAVAKDAGRTTRMFAGPTAKTADHAALAKARELKANGASREQIWDETGWDLDKADGVPRFEIDDSGSADISPMSIGLKSHNNTSDKMLYHPEYYKAYPESRDMRVQFLSDPSVGGAYYEGKGFVAGGGTPKQSRLSIALHELQHDAQYREGFAVGSNPKGSVNDALHEINSEINGVISQMNKAKGANLKALKTRASELVAQKERLAGDIDPMDAYMRHAGEVEARNVQARMNMTPAERRAKAPWLTQDVPDEQQIVRRLK